ncbi:MAG TPA: AMP-binding protein, partial [Thermoanaerobaculia bacterium]|nr:AMP-binding protein [Thermoanaerobaculia bacterium]
MDGRPDPDPSRGAGAAESGQEIPRPALPGEVRSAPPKDFELRTMPLPVTPRTTRMIESLAHELNASLESVLLAVWRVLLCRLTGERALVSRVCRDGRQFRELERALGLFAWSVPVDDSIDEAALFHDVVNGVEQALSSSLATPVSTAGTSGDEPPASFEFVELSEDDAPGGLTFRVSRQEALIERFTIQLSWVHGNDHTTAQLRYDASHFSVDSAGRIADAFSTLVTSVVANPRSPVSSLDILSEAERERIVRGFNEASRDYGEPVSASELFERAVATRESDVAVVAGRERLTYLELNRRANQLAAHLRDLGVRSETVVGVCVGRSINFPIAVLSVLKAGAAWLPLEPAYPGERLSAIVKDARPAVLLTEGHLAADLPDATLSVVRIDLDLEGISRRSPENVKSSGSPRDAAYVIYTSGSTGQPKGVVLTQGGLANYLQAMGEAVAIDPSDVYLHTASIGFSSSVRQ